MLLSAIILAKTDSELSFSTTFNCINSLVNSESFNETNWLEIIIVESNKEYRKRYKYQKEINIIVPKEDFGFHKFLNIGIKASKGNFIALCNNDLLFQAKWFSEILKIANKFPKIKSFSPIDNRFEENKFSQPFEIGYKVQQQVKGWCLVANRELFSRIKFLDEDFKFYYSDNDYALTLLYYNIKHAVVPNSKVQHLHKIVTKESEKKDIFFTQVAINKKIPKYLYRASYKWILENNRVLSDHLTYYNKWGKPDSIYRLVRFSKKLNNLGLNFIVKALFQLKRIVKL